MALPKLRDRLGEGGFVLSAWSGMADAIVHETLLRSGFDALAFDVQHGVLDLRSLEAGIALCGFAGVPALVRLPIEDRATAARVLDFGASAVIMPMIEGAEDARAFVNAVKYPPVGERSFGPTRATALHSYSGMADYVAEARQETLAFAMIETASAVAALDEILGIDGLDGVFVGPSDLSIALSGTGRLDPDGMQAQQAIRDIAAAVGRAGKIGAIYAAGAEDARRYRSYGYRLVCVGSDIGMLAAGAAALANAARR